MHPEPRTANPPTPLAGDRLSMWTLVRVFRAKILITWTLTII